MRSNKTQKNRTDRKPELNSMPRVLKSAQDEARQHSKKNLESWSQDWDAWDQHTDVGYRVWSDTV